MRQAGILAAAGIIALEKMVERLEEDHKKNGIKKEKRIITFNLYQTHKAMENAVLAVKDDGIIIIAGKCRDGLGEESFAEALNGKLSLL